MIQQALVFAPEKPKKQPVEPKIGTQCSFILNMLKERQWVNTIEIMERKGLFCRNLAVAARIYDLKHRFNWDIESRISKENGQGEYRLK